MERGTVNKAATPPALGAATMAEAFAITVREDGDRVALRTRGGELELTWGEYGSRVDRLALGLRALGVGRGDIVALMLDNRPEFHIADSACISLGATPFSLYQTLTADQIAHQLEDSGAEVAIVESKFLERVLEAAERIPALRHVVLVDGDAVPDGVHSFTDLLESEGDPAEIAAAREAVEPEDLLTLIYTSGTTGPPKGVQITHSNMMTSVQALQDSIEIPQWSRVISYLPMAHIAERATGHYLPIVLGHTVTTCPNPREVMAYLPEV